MASVTREVDANPRAKGLAIIITNDYIGTPEFPHKLEQLDGTKIDGENFTWAFRALNFVVYWEHNVTKGRLEQIMYEVRHLRHKRVKDYKCIVLMFSGHGTDDNYIYLQDHERARISDDLIASLLPKRAPELGNIPKLFFIDACRGSKEMKTVLVPRGKSANEISRGCTPLTHLVPDEGNFLIAYSTMPKYRAYEDKDKGGIWLAVLVEKIMESPGVSIGDVLVEVNQELLKKSQSPNGIRVQQPEQLNRLNKNVVLLERDDEQATVKYAERPSVPRRKPTIAAVFPVCSPSDPTLQVPSSQSQPGMYLGNSQSQPHICHTPITNAPLLITQGGPSGTGQATPLSARYQTMLNEYAQKNCISRPSYETVHCYSSEHKRQYFKSTVTVHLRNGMIIEEDSRQYYITQQLSQEEAAKNACEVIGQRQMQCQQLPPQYNGAQSLNQQWPQAHNNPVNVTTQVYTQPQTGPRPLMQGQQSYNGTSCGASVFAPVSLQQNSQPQVSGKGLPTSGSNRDRLNHFFQTNKVNPQYDYVSDNSGGQPRYRCTIKYFMNGKTERVDSGGYYCSKGEAKESAAKKILIKEMQRGKVEVVSRGRNTTPQDKVWKSKLKEYYDKRGEPHALIEYKTVEVALGRFQSTVFTRDFGPGGVQGDVCDSKKEAEQNAAQKALEKLNQSVCM